MSEANHVYLVTFATDGRRPWFLDPDLAQAACEALLDDRSWQRSELLAWVLMPDHWHGLIELAPRDSLPALVRQLKCSASRRVRAAMGTVPAVAAVWASAYHDRAVRREASLLSAARYVVANPVRAGLVRQVREYRYWGAVWAPDAGYRAGGAGGRSDAVAACAAPTPGTSALG